jgi:5-methylcytosine-specific restriction endonuclease McrA
MDYKFLENKYSKWYFNIVANARFRVLEGYSEKHHIIPKSLGGQDSDENLVSLYTCEHCAKTTTKGNYKRWHGDKCKLVQGVLKFHA